CLEKKADRNVMREMLDMNHLMGELPSHLRLPLLDMLMPALKSLSQSQYQQLITNIHLLIRADHHVSMFEYALHRMLLRHLKPTFEGVHDIQVRYQHIQQVAGSCACILTMLIQYGQHEHPKHLLASVSMDLLGERMPWPPARLLQMKYLDTSLSQLEQASPEIKQALLTACVDVIFADGICNEHAMEGLRAIADGMDCPIAMVSI
ncbi:MAG: hypothetical protein Q9M10_05455, partial [Mariprofundaceae bacterium]|nr:hypothetical protein [Mariprofundaceae bacterium]